MQCLRSHMVQLEAISIHKQYDLVLPNFLHEINIHYMTYLIGPHIARWSQ